MDPILLRPVLIIDEAQQMRPEVLSELRLLASAPFDCATYLTVVLCGDQRLGALFRQEELVPLAGRIRTRLVMDYAAREQLRELLIHVMTQAGTRVRDDSSAVFGCTVSRSWSGHAACRFPFR